MALARRDQWPVSWRKMKTRVCRKSVALGDHLGSDTDWGNHCDESLKKAGFINVGDGTWPSCYLHTELDLHPSVHVDEFKLAGPANHMKKGWQLIASKLELGPSQPLNL